MAKAAKGIRYTVSKIEHQLLLRGLGCLKVALLDDAGKLAEEKLRGAEGGPRLQQMKALSAKGRAVLDQVELLKALHERLRLLTGDPPLTT